MNLLKVPVIRLPEATVFLEQWDDMTFGHCDVRKWSPGVAKSLKEAWEGLLRLHGGPIYALHDPWDQKHRKWCELFGFSFHEPVDCRDGRTREIWIRR